MTRCVCGIVNTSTWLGDSLGLSTLSMMGLMSRTRSPAIAPTTAISTTDASE